MAVPGFHELKLTLIEGFADGVENEGLSEGLLRGADDVTEGDGHSGGDFGVERAFGAIGEGDLTVDKGGIGAGGRLMEGPGEV